MTKFRTRVCALLHEAKVYRVPTKYADMSEMRIIVNPSANEYEQFKSNTRYNAIRGIVVDKQVYICDAAIGTHDSLNGLVHTYILNADRGVIPQAMFEEDEYGNFQVRRNTEEDLPNVDRIFKDKKDARNYKSRGYFDNESYYNEYEFEHGDGAMSYDEWLKVNHADAYKEAFERNHHVECDDKGCPSAHKNLICLKSELREYLTEVTQETVDTAFALTEANPTLDRYYQTQAQIYYQAFYDTVKQGVREGWQIPGARSTEKGFEIDIKDVTFSLEPKEDRLASYIPALKRCRLFVLEGADSLGFEDYVNILGREVELSIVHELMHKFDMEMIQGKGRGIPATTSRSEPIYYNNTLEFNAIYQSIIRGLEPKLVAEFKTFVQNLPVKVETVEVRKMIDSAIKEFGLTKLAFVENLTPRNRKKLYVRIYEYFISKFNKIYSDRFNRHTFLNNHI